MKLLLLELLQIIFVQSRVIPSIRDEIYPVRTKARYNSERYSRQSFLGDTDTPVIKYDPQSKEGAYIAQKIESLFQNGHQSTSEDTGNYGIDVSQKASNEVESSNSVVGDGSTQFQLNLNLNVDLKPGKPSKLRVPQGELMLMFIPRIRGPNGASAVELSQSSLKKLLTESDQPTNMVMLPNGGVLLMSLTPDEDKMTRPRKTVTPASSTTQQFSYPDEWKDKMPSFPQVPDVTEEKDDLPVFPYKPYFSKDDNIVSSTTKKTFVTPSLSTTTSSTSTTTTSALTPISSTTTTTEISSKVKQQPYNNTNLSLLAQNEVDIHHPTLKGETVKKTETFSGGSATFIPFNTDSMKSRKNYTDIYERLKNYYLNVNNQNFIETNKQKPEKRFRLNDDLGSSSFDNVNVVIPGIYSDLHSRYMLAFSPLHVSISR